MRYQVRVSNDFRATTSANRMVAGLSIPQDGDGYVGELTDEQLAELQADRYVSVTTEDGKPVQEAASDDQGDDQAPNLDTMNREALNAHAASVGVEKPEELPTKAAVKDAIQAASQTPADGTGDQGEGGSDATGNDGSDNPDES